MLLTTTSPLRVDARRNSIVRSAMLGAVGAEMVDPIHHWRVGSVSFPAVGTYRHRHVMGALFINGR